MAAQQDELEASSESTPGLDLKPVQPKSMPFWRVLGTVLSLGLLVYLIRLQGWHEFIQVLGRLPADTFALAVAFMLLSRVCVASRWYVLLHSAKAGVNYWQCLRLTFMGLFASNFLPTTIGGDLVRMAGTVHLRVDAGIAAASLVLDRLIGMAGMSALAPVGLAIILRPAAGSVSPFSPALAVGLTPRLARLPGVGWVFTRLETFGRSLLRSSADWLRHPASLLWALLCTFGHMLFTFLTITVLLYGMHQPLSFWWIGGLWSLSYFVTLVPVSINGLGLQEVSITYLYSHFGGVSMEAGLALAVLMRMIFLLASLPGVVFLPDILRPLPAISAAKVE